MNFKCKTNLQYACSNWPVLRTLHTYSDFQASCNGKPKSVERHLHALMCSVSVVTVVFIYTMEDDQRLNTLVHEGDALRFSVYHCKKPENRCNHESRMPCLTASNCNVICVQASGC